MKGVAYAKALAEKFGSKLVLLHSVALQYYVTSDEYARYDFPLLMQQAEKAARNQMGDLVEKADWDGIEVESSLQIGHAGQQICARAIDHVIFFFFPPTPHRLQIFSYGKPPRNTSSDMLFFPFFWCPQKKRPPPPPNLL